MGVQTPTIPKDLDGFLRPDDPVAISFWVLSMAMVAATFFFLWEGMSIAYNWKTSMNVGALVTLIAAVHYFYMREYWVTIHQSPIVYRYIDWSLTVPLQMIEFYLILQAVKPDLGSGMFFILLEGFVGEGAQVAGSLEGKSEAVKSTFNLMRFIVSVGWSIYPLGYFFGYLLGAVADDPLNLIYNIADFVNKIWFCLAVWQAAKNDTLNRMASGELKVPLMA